jgi:N-methylhydantoinase A/oxoprolinase/acetone carboxylase beta subunit
VRRCTTWRSITRRRWWPIDVIPVRERVGPDGVLLLPTTPPSRTSSTQWRAHRRPWRSCCCTHAHPAHEQWLASALRERLAVVLPACDVICSHAVLPEIREYERMATTVAEAYARPAVRRYLETLGARLAAHGYPVPRVMTSAGGTLTATDAAGHAASLALSGPAGGVTGAAAVARALGIDRALTIDIGGTSADGTDRRENPWLPVRSPRAHGCSSRRWRPVAAASAGSMPAVPCAPARRVRARRPDLPLMDAAACDQR